VIVKKDGKNKEAGREQKMIRGRKGKIRIKWK